MEQDIASEPVDLNDDAGFMDTGVLHQARVCVDCGENRPSKGSQICPTCAKEVGK